MALEQLPVDPHTKQVIVRSDSAAHSHEFPGACRDRHVRFIVGAPLVEAVQSVLWSLPACRWVPAVSADGTDERDNAQVVEITDLMDLWGWPRWHPGYRVRRLILAPSCSPPEPANALRPPLTNFRPRQPDSHTDA
jgi:hypothetical protein